MSNKRLTVALIVILAALLPLGLNVFEVHADTFGMNSLGTSLQGGLANLMMGSMFSLNVPGTVSSVSVYVDGFSPAGNVKVAIYDDDAANGVPKTLQVQSSSSSVSGVGWATLSISSTSLTAGYYWLMVVFDNVGSRLRFSSGGSSAAKSMSFASAFPSSWGGTSGTNKFSVTYSIYATYSTGPPPNDFSISATPTSQSVGGGSTASFTLNLAASVGFTGTVSLSVTSGSPPGVTPTITPNSVSSFPNTATLFVPTLITTSGTFNILVTATCSSPSITHTVTVTLSVIPPPSYSFNVKATATQVVVTLTYSWSGSGSPPLGSITIAGPGGTPTLSESGAVVYDRTSITVSGSTSTYSIIHRATFTITAPGSAQTWTALISLSGLTSYNVAIEVS
jgi:hypothetical protein